MIIAQDCLTFVTCFMMTHRSEDAEPKAVTTFLSFYRIKLQLKNDKIIKTYEIYRHKQIIYPSDIAHQLLISSTSKTDKIQRANYANLTLFTLSHSQISLPENQLARFQAAMCSEENESALCIVYLQLKFFVSRGGIYTVKPL